MNKDATHLHIIMSGIFYSFCESIHLYFSKKMNQNEVHGFQKYLTPKWGLLLLSLIYFSLQIPFIKADPDIQISWSRGANTDEGLHASQIRNLINHGNLGLQESDNFIKTPLFGAFLL